MRIIGILWRVIITTWSGTFGIKWTCEMCDKMATWIYMPDSNFYCDEHVSGGCSCREDKNQPCIEYEYSKDGFVYGTWAHDILMKMFKNSKKVV
jgi:hypothetical protein